MPRDINQTIIFGAIIVVIMLCYMTYSALANAKYLSKLKEVQNQLSGKIEWKSSSNNEVEGLYSGYKVSLRLLTGSRSAVYNLLEIRLYGSFPKLTGLIVEFPEVEKRIMRSNDSLFSRIGALESYPENSLAPVVIRKLNIMVSKAKELESRGV
jgi:hypothetical protein